MLGTSSCADGWRGLHLYNVGFQSERGLAGKPRCDPLIQSWVQPLEDFPVFGGRILAGFVVDVADVAMNAFSLEGVGAIGLVSGTGGAIVLDADADGGSIAVAGIDSAAKMVPATNSDDKDASLGRTHPRECGFSIRQTNPHQANQFGS